MGLFLCKGVTTLLFRGIIGLYLNMDPLNISTIKSLASVGRYKVQGRSPIEAGKAPH